VRLCWRLGKGRWQEQPMRIGIVIATLVLVGLGAFPGPAHAGEAVDAIVVLAADVSRSINDDEFTLQRRGYAAAIVSPKLIEAIGAGPHGAIALCYVEWAGPSEQKIVVDWKIVHGPADAEAFAATLLAAPRAFVGRTAIGSAIDFAMATIGASGFSSDRKVIDVSGDGTSNQGRPAPEARDVAVAAGAVINGLSIFNRSAAAESGYLALHTNPPGGLAQYYRDNVIGGPGAFVLPIDDFGKFSEAMIRKLIAEIANAAAPATGG
jgi:hypothetical protein